MPNRNSAIEDNTLNNPRPLVSSRITAYTDIDATFENKNSQNPQLKGDIYKKYDVESVKQAIKILLLTNHGEKPFNPYFGGNLTTHLFNLDDDVADDINQSVRMAINNYEPRVRLISVDTISNSTQNSISVKIIFQIINTSEQSVLDLNVQRIR